MYAVFIVILTITVRYICSDNSYFDKKREGIYAVLTVSVTMTVRSICNANS